MPLTMKIQPIDSTIPECFESVKTVPKSRLRRLFDFSSFLRGSAVADRSVAGDSQCGKDCSDEFEPSSVCLDKMVQNFIEESNEKQSVAASIKCGRHNHHQCNCVNGNNFCSSDGSEDEFDSFNCFGNSNNHSSSTDACDLLKSLVICETVSERNLLADVSKIVEKNKICKRKDEISRKIVADGLLASGYAVSACKSRWEKTSTYPAGEYEYIEAVVEGDRLIIDIDFRSEFEIARSTKSYKAKQSLKKKGMPLPPWRRADYVKSKWLSPCTRIINNTPTDNDNNTQSMIRNDLISDPKDPNLMDEFEVIGGATKEDEGLKEWEPLEIKAKVPKTGGKVVSGLASVIEGN
ncbi:unnamed protein product [Lactuca virosa]|uniref:Uncharacterized protein n=1 Tax=Lactuca virosa TaxID=75947 RepID=A0AAU9PB80_9ASTR|nr:unnamed protein product [Lactuca virosa]